ncbi:MAG: GGDEF domain-containing protein [Lentisphaerae bacterium]|nr:GGDEF domain-containing protein [Lentisphaerota bacterium]
METCYAHQTNLLSSSPQGNDGAAGPACLIRIHPPSIGEGIIHLPPGAFIVGRDSDCNLGLGDRAVSRQHARIEFDEAKQLYRIRDLESLNGTHLNNHRVQQQILSTGDLLRIGKSVFKFLVGDGIERQYHEAIYTMTITDGLTGIANKRYFLETLERETIRSQRHQRPFALAMVDVDHFKQVNDTHGHLVGDAVLRELCDRMSAAVRRDELLARYGGEEFVVLLPESTRQTALLFAERLRERVGATPFVVEERTIPVTISIGIAAATGEEQTPPTELIARADAMLYAAKHAGRNSVRG